MELKGFFLKKLVYCKFYYLMTAEILLVTQTYNTEFQLHHHNFHLYFL